MNIIPVIDLQRGRVVRGVAGQRDRYRPVESRWAADATPAAVARAWVDVFDFRRVYVADLDAIAGNEPDWTALAEIARAGMSLLLDAGTGDARRLRMLLGGRWDGACLEAVVIGLESVAEPTLLAEMVRVVGRERAVFSIDLRDRAPVGQASAWRDQDAERIAAQAVAAGFRRLILLDLASVGMRCGPALTDVCRAVRAAHPDVELISGGGVRDVADVRTLLAAGCDAVLVASALHDGRIRPVEARGQ